MKKNTFLFTSVLLFVLLFYHQEVALNLSIFSMVAGVFLFFDTAPQNRGRLFWLLSVATFIAVVSFAWYGDFISFAALFVSFLLWAYKAYYPGLNVLTFPFGTAFNYASFIFRAPLIHKWMQLPFSSGKLLKKVIGYFVIPAILVVAFTLVYTLASEKFASLVVINWRFDFFEIGLLTAIGFFFMFSLFHFTVPKLLVHYNGYLGDDFVSVDTLKEAHREQFFDVVFQRRSGGISLILLNALLVFFIVTYSLEQFGSKEITATLSSEVHERVYVLMGSIVMAIVVIMVYFKGLLNFDRSAGLLKTLSFIWIGLNALLIVIAFIKNAEYVISYGLTFKRMGVFIFLLISLAGLFTTGYKLMFKKTNVFLVNRMVWLLFSVLVVSSFINWSWIVTRYNVTHFKNPDWSYLYSLQYNKQLLYDIGKQNHTVDLSFVENVKRRKASSFLSSNLYYWFLDFK